MVGAGEPVVAIAGRTRDRAERAAQFISSTEWPDGTRKSLRVIDCSEVPRIASRVLIAVADEAIGPVAEVLAAAGLRSGVALHTCGSRGPSALLALSAAGVACGVLHPLQTIMTAEQGVTSLTDITFGVSGDGEAISWAQQIVTALRSRSLRIDTDRLGYYHAGAVMASNALMAALDAAIVLFERAGVERAEALGAIAPLARTSVNNALARGSRAALTGPIARGDAVTVGAHMRALRAVDPTVGRLYEAATGQLLQLARQRGLAEDRVRAIELAMKG